LPSQKHERAKLHLESQNVKQLSGEIKKLKKQETGEMTGSHI